MSAGSNTIVAHVSADNDSDRTDNDGSGAIVVEPPADVSVTLHGPATAMANETIHRRLRRRQHRCGQRRDGHGADRHPGGHDGPQRLADQRQLHERRCAASSARSRRSALASTASGSVSLMASAAGNAALHAAVSGDYFDHEQCQRHGRPRRRRQRRSLRSRLSQAAAASGGGGAAARSACLLLLALAPLHRARRRRA